MSKSIDLTFGPRSFSIRPLTIGQVCELSSLFSGDIGASQADRMSLARDAIRIALKRDHADADIDDLECDVQQLPKQLVAIMEAGGFTPAGEAPPAGGNAGPTTGQGSSEAA